MKKTLRPPRVSLTPPVLRRGFCLLLFGALLAGCSGDKTEPGPARRDQVIIKGSNTFGEELAPRLIAEYKKAHPTAAINLETRGSASGFWGLIGGVCDIAASSRTIMEDEQRQAKVRGIEMNDHVIGAYCVAVAVHPSNTIPGLSRDQVRDIFTGAIQNWKDVGGLDAPIHLCIRNPLAGTYLGFRELALQDQPYSTNNLTEFNNYAAIMEAVAKDPNAIGYASFDLASKPGVKALSIAGVPPTSAAVKEGKYPFARFLHLYTDKTKEPPVADDFIHFIQSARGQEIVAQIGFIPIP